MYEYHKWSKNDKFLRKAIYEAYGQKCARCGIPITAYSDIQIDHIYPAKAPTSDDEVINLFLDELREDGFDTEHPDYIENYRLLCGNCNRQKSNKLLEASSYRELFQKSKEKTPIILALIANYKQHIPTDIDNFKPENMSVQCLTGMPPLVTDKDIIHRGPDVEKILEMLEGDTPAVLLSGFGGIGKTALAQLLFHKIKGEFDEVAWIPYQGTLANSVVHAIQLFEDLKPADRWQPIIHELKNNGKRKLIVIDNADHDEKKEQNPAEDDNLSAITGWNKTTVIITSRLTELQGYQLHNVGFLNESACVDIFYRYYKNDPERKQKDIVVQLVRLSGCHTFTVELLAKGANREIDLQKYCETVSNSYNNAGHKFKVSHHPDRATISGHLKKLFDLQQRSDGEKKALLTFSALPVNLALSSEEAVQWFGLDTDILDRLIEDGWLAWTENGYSIHPLLKDIFLLDELPEDTAEQFLSFIEDYHNNYFLRGEVYTATMRKLEIIESVLNTLPKTVDKETTQFANIYHNAASAYRQLADYDTALVFNQKALRIREAKLGTDHPNTATTYNNIAVVYQDKGDYDNALSFHQKALKISEAKLGTDHLSTATTYNNIAGVYKDKGDYDNALRFYQKALNAKEKTIGTDHPSTATTYNNIALVYKDKGDYDNALRFYQKALEICEAKLGTDHPSTATTYNNIAVVYQDKGDYDNALCFYQKALNAKENTIGTDHPSTATTYNNIAVVYKAKGDYDNALCFYQKDLKISEAKLGTDHPDTATTYNNIAGVYYAKCDYDNALSFYQKALKICEAKLGTDHPSTATTYNNIAGVYYAKGDYDNALSFYQKDLKICEAKLGTDHPSTATTYNNIALVYQDKGDYDNALSFHQKALRIREAKLGTDHPDTATTYNNIAVVYQAKGDYDNALSFYQKDLKICEAKLGTDHPSTAITYLNIGVLQYKTGFYQDGLENLLKAYLVFASRLGLEHPDTKNTFSWLSDCYMAACPNGEPFEDWLQKQLDASTDE